MDKEQLKTAFDKACNDYVTAFVEKQGYQFDGWIGDDVGGIAEFAGQYFFNIGDIIQDIDTEQPEGLIMQWQDESLEFSYNKPNCKFINYKSYCMGLRYGIY